MEERLISKKELLARYGISYGALYRWKRMGLIPEEWFIKKSTGTGQETFFLEDVITRRIDQIIAAKDVTSLQALASSMTEKKTREDVLEIETAYGSWQCPLSDVRRNILNGSIDLTAAFSKILEETEEKENQK